MNHSEERDNFIESADARETSLEIMMAIADIAHSVEQAERIWAYPFEEELEAICEALEKPSSSYVWGSAGDDWL